MPPCSPFQLEFFCDPESAVFLHKALISLDSILQFRRFVA